MSQIGFLYPVSPSNVPAAITQPSPAFKKEVSGVMASIVLFFIVYILLFLLSIGLIIACVYLGIAIILNVGHLLAILAGIGLIGVGIMVFIFLIKFLFAVTRFDHSNSILISEDDQPELFGFIRQVTRDTQTPFPKKIYLSPEVNACVFYDSSFWSMILPIKKNLQIGLGLVNSLNVSEFKAVMAHEFGHFSQRSMKLGSFVYNVNKIIHNMLFENTSYSNVLGNWASVHGVFAIFATITARIAEAIQWILRQMYGVVNKNYMRLSREMEFHADAVAASVSGSQSLVTALRRLQLADTGYNIALQKCDDLFRENKISYNIYDNHKTVLKHLTTEFRLATDAGLPVVTDEFLSNNNSSRINFKDQWASHPTTADREKRLLQLGVVADTMKDQAWALFRDRENLQLQLTKKIYEKAVVAGTPVTIDEKEFEERLHGDINQFTLPEEYKGFYDGRQINIPAAGEAAPDAKEKQVPGNFREIFSAENIALPKKINALRQDIEVLAAIENKTIQVKTFDFDGAKYARTDIPQISNQLKNELKQQEEELIELDGNAHAYFLRRAIKKGGDVFSQLDSRYREYFALRQKAEKFLAAINEMLGALGPIFSGQTIQIEQINKMISHLKDVDEPVLKNYLRDWLAEGVFAQRASEITAMEKFINSDSQYFSGTSFFDNELAELNRICVESWKEVSTRIFGKFKDIAEWQLMLIDQEGNNDQ